MNEGIDEGDPVERQRLLERPPAASGCGRGNRDENSLKVDEFEAAVVVLDDRGERLDPVAGVEIMDVADHLVGRRVDVAADDAAAAAVARERGELVLEFARRSSPPA